MLTDWGVLVRAIGPGLLLLMALLSSMAEAVRPRLVGKVWAFCTRLLTAVRSTWDCRISIGLGNVLPRGGGGVRGSGEVRTIFTVHKAGLFFSNSFVSKHSVTQWNVRTSGWQAKKYKCRKFYTCYSCSIVRPVLCFSYERTKRRRPA